MDVSGRFQTSNKSVVIGLCLMSVLRCATMECRRGCVGSSTESSQLRLPHSQPQAMLQVTTHPYLLVGPLGQTAMFCCPPSRIESLGSVVAAGLKQIEMSQTGEASQAWTSPGSARAAAARRHPRPGSGLRWSWWQTNRAMMEAPRRETRCSLTGWLPVK